MRKLTKKSKSVVVGLICLIFGSCLAWQLLNAKISRPASDQKAAEVLKADLSLELTTNTWLTVNASGGLVGSPFYSFRWWREYFIEKEGNFAALESLSDELKKRHAANDFEFLPLGYAETVLPYPKAASLAPWWQPETNKGPMMYVSMNNGGRIIYVYGFKSDTNALVYIHLIEHRE